MSLQAVVTAVNAILVGNNSVPAAGANGLVASAKAIKLTPPSIHWIPTQDRYTGADAAVPQREQVTSAPARLLRIRWAGVEAHLWAGGVASANPGDDFSALEALINNTISAIHDFAYGNYQLGRGRMMVSGTEAAKLGHRYVLPVEFALPILQVPQSGAANPSQVQIAIITQTTQMAFPDGQVASRSPGV